MLSPWRFSSKRSDELTGLVYYGRRFYIPQHGRWLTPDPAGFSDGMNLYAFVHNDPLTHLDLYGLLIFPTTTSSVSSMMRDIKQQEDIRRYLAGEYKFEDHYAHYNPGMISSTSASSKPRGEVFFFPGIRTQFDGEKEFTGMLKYISKLGGGIPVHGVHMPTFGLKNDLLNCDTTFKTKMNSTILHIERALRESSERVGEDGRILVFSSSAGAMNFFFGGIRLPKEIRDKVDFRGFAGAKIVPEDIFGSARNYMSTNHDFLMTYHRYCNRDEYNQALHTGLLQKVWAHPDASRLNDHGFLSPTFQIPIKLSLKPFANQYDCR